MLNLVRGGLQAELDHFFHSALDHEHPRQVTKSAFCQARLKVKPQALRALLQQLASQVRAAFHGPRWHGWRVLAADGSTLRLPDQGGLREHFGGMKTSCGTFRALGRFVSLFDVATQITFDAVVAPYHTDERSLLASVLDQVASDELLLLDRGFPSFALFDDLERRRIPFCARIDATRWSAAKAFVRSDQSDRLVTFTPSTAVANKLRARGIVPRPLRLRLIKHRLPNGSLLVLVTSVLDTAIPSAEFADLYQWRWRIEEGYKHLKSRAELENWSGMSACAVQQDFYCKYLNAGVAALLAYSATPIPADLEAITRPTHKGWRVRPNLTYTLSQLRHRLPRIFLGLDIVSQTVALLHHLIINTQERTKPLRQNPRWRGVRIHGHYTAYKPCA